MKTKTMILMIKIWTFKVIKIFNLKEKRTTVINLSEIIQPKKILVRVRRKKINCQVSKRKTIVIKTTNKKKSPYRKQNSNSLLEV